MKLVSLSTASSPSRKSLVIWSLLINLLRLIPSLLLAVAVLLWSQQLKKGGGASNKKQLKLLLLPGLKHFSTLCYLKIVHVSLYACRRLHFMSLYEEEMLLRQLRPGAEKNTLNAEQRRLYRKLSLRNTKRSVGQAPFNFDRLVAKLSGKEWSEPNVSDSPLKVIGVSNVLDRFQKGCFQGSVAQSRLNMSFHRRLFGNDDDYIPEPFVSPYTGRYTFFYIFFNYKQMLMSHYVDLGH